MSSNKETLVEEFCHTCGKLVAIAGFREGSQERRRKDILYFCDWCAQGDLMYYKRPPEDEIIIATIASREGAANDRQKELLVKYGPALDDTPRYKLLLGCHEAKKKNEAGDYKGSNAELLSIIKTIARM